MITSITVVAAYNSDLNQMRAPNQLSAVTNESLLFPTTMDSECPISPDLLIIILKLGKNTYKSNTMILLLMLFYYIISKNLSFIT